MLLQVLDNLLLVEWLDAEAQMVHVAATSTWACASNLPQLAVD